MVVFKVYKIITKSLFKKNRDKKLRLKQTLLPHLVNWIHFNYNQMTVFSIQNSKKEKKYKN